MICEDGHRFVNDTWTRWRVWSYSRYGWTCRLGQGHLSLANWKRYQFDRTIETRRRVWKKISWVWKWRRRACVRPFPSSHGMCLWYQLLYCTQGDQSVLGISWNLHGPISISIQNIRFDRKRGYTYPWCILQRIYEEKQIFQISLDSCPRWGWRKRLKVLQNYKSLHRRGHQAGSHSCPFCSR